MTAVDPDLSFLVDALEPRRPSTQGVLGRNSSALVPGNGAMVVLARNPDNSRGFTVITSYPTLSSSLVGD
jgi:hypothetical protein